MKKLIFCLSLLLMLVLFAGYGYPGQYEDFKRLPSQEQREKIRKRIETLKMWKMTKALDLNEERAAKLFPLINGYDNQRFAVRHDMRNDMGALRKSVDTASEDELKALLEKLAINHRKMQKINDEEMEKLREILPVRDLAKFIIFKKEFNRDMRRIISEVRGKREKKSRGKYMRPPDEDLQ